MQRVTMRIPDEQIGGLEDLVDAGEYPNRSEAVRAAVRDLLDQHDANVEDTNMDDTPAPRRWTDWHNASDDRVATDGGDPP